IEALETDFPLLVRELSIRRGSGGAGRHGGGEGIVRDLEAREPMRYTLIAERRRHPPAGRDGGAPGAPGRGPLRGKPIDDKSEGELAPGDRLRIETPGGGGHGDPTNGKVFPGIPEAASIGRSTRLNGAWEWAF